MTTPDEKTFAELAENHDLVPVFRRFPADTETPVSTYLKTADGPWSFLFESVEGQTRWGRYSIVGFDPFITVEAKGEKALASGPGIGTIEGHPLDVIREVLKRNRAPRIPGLPRFAGGLVGYFGYGAARLFEKLPEASEPDPAGLPDIRLFAPGKLIAFDNVLKTLDIIVLTRPGADPGETYAKAVREIDVLAGKLKTGLSGELIHPPTSPPSQLVPAIKREDFEAMVVKAKEAIHAGEAIQIVLSQSFEGPCSQHPFTVYRALRALNPSPYLFHLSMGEETLVGASPETMVRVEGGRAVVRPIAGTRPRSEDPDRDAELADELAADEKERAEHVMLVDLGRNDLGRVSVPGGVRLDESFVIERYSHVMHLVSTVSAELRRGVDALDVLQAAFPAGTVSGAPKVRAMELIAAWEPRERGFYAGSVGYLGFDGNMDTCITIRTMLFKGGRAYLQAGAGIVADSDPAKEYEETLHKARALERALQSAASGLVFEQGNLK